MKTSNDGFQQCYNAQVAVDGAHQLVVATEVTANASDQGGVPALLDALAETVGEQPETEAGVHLWRPPSLGQDAPDHEMGERTCPKTRAGVATLSTCSWWTKRGIL